MKPVQELSRVAPEMLAGLHADAALRQRILSAQSALHPWTLRRLAPIGVAALVLVGGVTAWLRTTEHPAKPGTVTIEIQSAGGSASGDLLASLDVPGDSVQIGNQAKVSAFQSLLARGDNGNFPLIGYNGSAYRMLTAPGSLSKKALGDSLGTVALYTDEPSLTDADAWYGLLSNAAEEGSEVYAVAGLSSGTAVAAQVDGEMRLFQRASYADYGSGGGSLEDVLSVRGKVKSLDLSGVGVVEDSAAANALMSLLLDNAVFQGDGSASGKQALNIRLNNGLTLQLLVSGDTLSCCGAWSCAEFFSAFQAALPVAQPAEQEAPSGQDASPEQQAEPPVAEAPPVGIEPAQELLPPPEAPPAPLP